MQKELQTYFQNALIEILQEMGFENIQYQNGAPAQSKYDLIAMVGITGDIHGISMIKMERSTAFNFVKEMMELMGMESLDSDEFSNFHKEAIGEAVNQFSGRATILLSEDNLNCDITPPTILTGKNIVGQPVNTSLLPPKIIHGNFGTFSYQLGVKKA